MAQEVTSIVWTQYSIFRKAVDKVQVMLLIADILRKQALKERAKNVTTYRNFFKICYLNLLKIFNAWLCDYWFLENKA